jgi:multidrug efflux pump subunit AcrB
VIEQEVTSKLEGLFNALKGVQEISSLSKKGSGIIQLILKEDTNRDLFRFEVLNVIRQNYQSFPEDVSYPTLSKNTFEENESPVLSYTIQANESANTIKRYVESYITPKLSEVDGIRQISLYGATPFEWVITYETDRLSQHELSVDDVAGAVTSFLKKQELGKGISANETGDKEVPLKLVCKSSTVIDWNKIPIKKLGDRVLFLEDVAQVAFQKGTVNEYYRVNGLNTLNLVVYADANTNIIKLSQDMTQKIVQVQKSLRSGYFIKKTSDSSDYLVKELTKIQKRALFSMLILLLLSILIYRHYKYLFVLFASIVITLIVAVIFYVLFDVQIQLYSLAGITISFGIIIDNCIIMMDHVLLKKNRKAFLAILAATFTTIGAVLIIFFLEKEQQLNLLDFAIVIGINIGCT